MRSSRMGLCERSKQRVDTARAVITHAVDKKGGGAVDPAFCSALEILAYAREVRAGQNFGDHTAGIEAQSRGVLGEILISERVLVLEQEVVHLPELSLCAGRFGGFGRVLRVRMRIDQWKISKGEAQAIAQTLLNRFDDRVNFTAKWALVVAVFNERDGRVNGTLKVIALRDRQGQF